MSNNREGGHNLEREIARDLRPFFPKVATSRAASRVLDNCGVDIANVPFLIQAKKGYVTKRFNFQEMKEKTLELLSKHTDVPKYPYLLIRKIGPTKIVEMDIQTYTKLSKKYKPETVNIHYVDFLKMLE